jgi:hypothetical protein
MFSWCQEVNEIAKEVERTFPDSSCSARLLALAAVVDKGRDSSEFKFQLQAALHPVLALISSRLLHLERQPPNVTTPRSGRNEFTEQFRAAGDALRRLWDDNFSRIEQEMLDRVRARMLPLSLIPNRIQNMAEDLSESSLTSAPVGKNIRLQITSEVRRGTESLLGRSLEDVVKEDVAWLNHEQSELLRKSCSLLPAISGNEHPLTLDEFAASAIFDWLKPQLTLNLKYSGEIPHRSFLDRLSHGRRPVFAVMMITSLVGAGLGLGRSIPAAIAPVALLLFLGGIIWTFRSFGEERQWLMERELGRLRESMTSESQRCVEGLLKEWSSRAIRLLRDRQKSLQRQYEDWSKSSVARFANGDGFRHESQHEHFHNPQSSVGELLRLRTKANSLLETVMHADI